MRAVALSELGDAATDGQTYSFAQGASRLKRRSSSLSYLYIASSGDISVILFVNEKDLSAVEDDAIVNAKVKSVVAVRNIWTISKCIADQIDATLVVAQFWR